METSNLLKLPYIMPSQAQKHVIHNEAIRALDCIVQLAIISDAISSPPESPAEGDRYIVGSDPTGAWENRAGQVACFVDGAWMFFAAVDGWQAWNHSARKMLVFHDGEWQGSGGDIDGLDYLGINQEASESERFAVGSHSSLFSHEGGDHRLKINKANVGDTASLLFQNGYSGRAEFGLAGSDAFSVKVSPDGINWVTTLEADPVTGDVGFPSAGVAMSASLFANLLPDSGRFNAPGSQAAVTASTPVPPPYVTAFNGATMTFPHRFIHDNSTFGGAQGPLDPNVLQLIEKIVGASGLRYGPEFWCMKIEAGQQTTSPVTINNETFYRATISSPNPRPRRYTTGFFVRCVSGKAALRLPVGGVRRITRDGLEVAFNTSDVVINPADGWVYFEMQISRADISYELNDLSINLLPGASAFLALPRIAAGWIEFGSTQAVVTNDRVFGG